MLSVTNVTRRQVVFGLALTLACARLAQAQNRGGSGAWGIPWVKTPSITVLGKAEDGRIQLVRDAVQYWNRIFTELGTPFRLGAVVFMAGALPVDLLKDLSDTVVSRTAVPQLPDIIYEIKGDIIVALSDGNFVSFAARQPSRQKALVAIKSSDFYPMTLPNVARNVIAHELGHAIGLGHNSNPTMLMCGRPASCRASFISDRVIHQLSRQLASGALSRSALKFSAETDSAPEEAGFEPPVPLGVGLAGRLARAAAFERQLFPQWDRRLESSLLQRRVSCKPNFRSVGRHSPSGTNHDAGVPAPAVARRRHARPAWDGAQPVDQLGHRHPRAVQVPT